MAPSWGPGVASVIGTVGLLVVLLGGGCAAEGKSLVQGVRGFECAFMGACGNTCAPRGSWFCQVGPLCAMNVTE